MDEPPRPQPGPAPVPGDEPDPPAIAPPALPPPAPPPPAPPPLAPAPPAEPPAARRHTRRWVLAGGLAILAGGGAGVGAAFLRHHPKHRPPPPPPPTDLVAAAAAERRLIADLVATTGGSPDVRVVIAQATVNHRAHLAALEALLRQYRAPVARPTRLRGSPRTKAQLRAAEHSAAIAAAGRAAHQGIALAGLLASISACEATHAELLS